MADFYQTGVVATLHRLSPDGLGRLETELERHAEDTPIGLVLPALYSEFETPAMAKIARELREVRYLKRIVLALGRANREQYEHAKSFFDGCRTPVTVIWIDSEPVQRLLRMLDDMGLSAGADGKGRSCWLSYGYLLACGDCDAVALHDCDILSYDRQLLARLCYPIVNPNLSFEFVKGYYARVTDRMHGRVTRLFVTPLIRAISGMAPQTAFLKFLDSFRYALSGEFAMKINLARVSRIPSDWGLEVGMLAEVFRNCAPDRICQVDLADKYEHKHQSLSSHDAKAGLRRMSADIAKCLFRTLAGEGVVFGREHFRALQVRYVRLAEDTINRYYADALLNGLVFDRHAEEQAVATFAQSLRTAAEDYCQDPLGLPPIPAWNRVISAVPNFFEMLREAVNAAETPRPVVAVEEPWTAIRAAAV
jgi:glucosyl-3-phosphoglycerate synthase